jgi:hypothetical protein
MNRAAMVAQNPLTPAATGPEFVEPLSILDAL